jgi:predicted N-acetyltransferase YhbS
MAAITTPLYPYPPQLRSLNVLRDLPAVADLVEACFQDTMDEGGHRYIDQMRRAGKDNAFLRWAVHAADTVSMPLSGFVWEEDRQIIGNVSLIPFRKTSKRMYLIANVAVHQDHRRRGIGRQLTQAAIHQARQRNADGIWLHVRDDNPGAIRLYGQLGFRERARRTSWYAAPDRNLPYPYEKIKITSRHPRDWPQHKAWLEENHPELLAWYHPIPWTSIRPGLGPALYRMFMDYETRQWAAYRDDRLDAALTWQSVPGRSDRIWLAASSEREESLTALLLHVRRNLPWSQTLSLDYPAGKSVEAIKAAGFHLRRTLVWMEWDASKSHEIA